MNLVPYNLSSLHVTLTMRMFKYEWTKWIILLNCILYELNEWDISLLRFEYKRAGFFFYINTHDTEKISKCVSNQFHNNHLTLSVGISQNNTQSGSWVSINVLMTDDAYMRLWTISASSKVVACHLNKCWTYCYLINWAIMNKIQ